MRVINAPKELNPGSRKVCVAIGPFCGSKPWWAAQTAGSHSTGCPPEGMTNRTLSEASLYGCNAPSGSPRSHESPSLSPEMWQLAQAASPCAEDKIPSYRNRRPGRIKAGLGSWSGISEVFVIDAALTTAIEFENRFSTNKRS